MSGPNEGDESWEIAQFEEIEQPEKIVYIDNFSDKEGNINNNIPTFHSTALFNEEETGTKITVISIVGSEKEVKKLLEMGMVEGLSETWDRLEEYLEQI